MATEPIDVKSAAERVYDNFYGLAFRSDKQEYKEHAVVLTKLMRTITIERIKAAIRGDENGTSN